MKKKHFKSIFASFIMASAVLAGCNSGGDSAEKPEEKKQVETEDKAEVKKEVVVEDTDAGKQTAV